MYVTGRYMAVRVGAGIRPSVIIDATAQSVGEGWNPALQSIDVQSIELHQSEGDLNRLRNRIGELVPQHWKEHKQAYRRPGNGTGAYRRQPIPFDLVVDLTTDPAFQSMQPANCYLTIKTGAGDHRESLRYTIGRLLLMSVSNTAFSRGLVRFHLESDMTNQAQKALASMTVRGVTEDANEGLLVVNQSQEDDISLTICTLLWRILEHPPRHQNNAKLEAFNRNELPYQRAYE